MRQVQGDQTVNTKLPAELPERLEAEIAARGQNPSGGKREVWNNKALGIKLVVTWCEPYPDIGIQQFSCKHLPGYQWNNYEALRNTWREKFGGA